MKAMVLRKIVSLSAKVPLADKLPPVTETAREDV